MANIKKHKLVETLERTEHHKNDNKITRCGNHHIGGCYQLGTILTGSDQNGDNLGRTKAERWERRLYSCAINNWNRKERKVTLKE